MTQEEKYLLLQDLCARLPYGVICRVKYTINNETTFGEDIERECDGIVKRINFDNYTLYIESLGEESYIEDAKPYLRPMSSMTEEEREGYTSIAEFENYEHVIEDILDFLHGKHFDYRGLIEKGLAIEITEENNPYENNNQKTM